LLAISNGHSWARGGGAEAAMPSLGAGPRAARAVHAQRPQMGFGQHAPFGRGLLFKPQQTLVAQRESLALPHPAHRRRRHPDADQAQLLADPHVAVDRVAGGHLEDLLHQLGRGLVGHPGPAPRLGRQAVTAVLVERGLDLVEVAAADAGALARDADVLQLISEG